MQSVYSTAPNDKAGKVYNITDNFFMFVLYVVPSISFQTFFFVQAFKIVDDSKWRSLPLFRLMMMSRRRRKRKRILWLVIR